MRTLGAIALTAAACLLMAGAASASTSQQALIEDDALLATNAPETLDAFRTLGAQVVRENVQWAAIAPAASATSPPRGFDPTNPGAYPSGAWAPLDQIVIGALARGLTLELTVGGPAPTWAHGGHSPPGARGGWKPSAAMYGAFFEAVAKRYSGSYTPAGSSGPLPRAHMWEIWNEPNFGPQLAPQGTRGSKVLFGAQMYRGLLDRAWSALQRTGHGGDTILIGALAARGVRTGASRHFPQGLPGNFGMTKPKQFVRALYCVNNHDRPLRGAQAHANACPTSGGGSHRFRRQHPGLFAASGVSDHPYPFNKPPTKAGDHDPDFTEFSQLPGFGRELDRIQRAYGSHRSVPLYITEYGYITRPPDRRRFVSPPTAAVYINWAEYLAYRERRIRTTAQYLLEDPNPFHAPEYGGFASGLEFYGGAAKPSYDAYRLPLFLPVTSARRGRSLEVWGCVRPAPYAQRDTGAAQSVQIQFASTSSSTFATLRTVPLTDPHGYFDVRMPFTSSGSVRLAWSYPSGTLVYSRVQRVTVK